MSWEHPAFIINTRYQIIPCQLINLSPCQLISCKIRFQKGLQITVYYILRTVYAEIDKSTQINKGFRGRNNGFFTQTI